MKYTLVFSKLGYLRFISHLDMLRLFKRAFKRAEIFLKFSEGFNPHPKMTFAQPLSLGHSSICEILDIETKEEYNSDDIKERLNTVLPQGISIISSTKQPEDYKSIASRISWAEYIIELPLNEGLEEKILEFFNMKEIKTLKKQKKKKELKEVDIKPLIREFKILDNSEEYPAVKDSALRVLVKVDCGSISNLNVDLLMRSFVSWVKERGIEGFDFEDIDTIRVALG